MRLHHSELAGITVKLPVISLNAHQENIQYPPTVSLSVQIVCLYVGCYLSLPSVSVVEQLLLVVQQLLVSLCGELEVRTLKKEFNFFLKDINCLF